MSNRKGPPKHQNRFAWNPVGGRKINETEVGGKYRPFSEVTGVCLRCKEQIEWKRKYGKYKVLIEPAKCQKCSKRAVRQAYHNVCLACAKEHHICAKCSCRVERIIGKDLSEKEAEQKALDEAVKNARERDRRSLLRAMNKANPKSSSKMPPTTDGSKVGDLFPSSSLEEYAKGSKHHDDDEEEEEEDDDDDDEDDEDDDDGDGDGDGLAEEEDDDDIKKED